MRKGNWLQISCRYSSTVVASRVFSSFETFAKTERIYRAAKSDQVEIVDACDRPYGTQDIFLISFRNSNLALLTLGREVCAILVILAC